jgi:hypothetical protein
VAGNTNSGKEVMELLLSTHPDIQITAAIVTEAAGNPQNGDEVMELLLASNTSSRANASALKAAIYFGRADWHSRFFGKCDEVFNVNDNRQCLCVALEAGDQTLIKAYFDRGMQPPYTDFNHSDWTVPMVATQARNLWVLEQLGDVMHGSLNHPDPPTAWLNDHTFADLENDDRDIVYHGKSMTTVLLLN